MEFLFSQQDGDLHTKFPVIATSSKLKKEKQYLKHLNRNSVIWSNYHMIDAAVNDFAQDIRIFKKE